MTALVPSSFRAMMRAYNRSGAPLVFTSIGCGVGTWTSLWLYGFNAMENATTPLRRVQTIGRYAALGFIAGGVIGYTAPVSVPLLLLIPKGVYVER